MKFAETLPEHAADRGLVTKCVEARQLRNLQKAHLNCQLGTVLPICDKSAGARVKLVLINSIATLSVKRENLQIAPCVVGTVLADAVLQEMQQASCTSPPSM